MFPLMMVSTKSMEKQTTISAQELEIAWQFKYQEAILNRQGPKTEVLTRTAKTETALANLNLPRQITSLSCQTTAETPAYTCTVNLSAHMQIMDADSRTIEQHSGRINKKL